MADKKSCGKATTTSNKGSSGSVSGQTKPRSSLGTIGVEESAVGASGSSWGAMSLAEDVETAPLNSLGFPEEPMKKQKSFIEEELGSITDRLHRALGDISNLYEDDDETIDDERGLHQTRWEALDDRLRSIEGDRAELLASLKDSGDIADLSQFEEGGGAEVSDVLSALRDKMESTQTGFQKLKDLSVLLRRPQAEAPKSKIVTEVDLQAKVISRFQEMFKAKKTKVVKDRAFGVHWKHAAGEIVSLLSRIRQEGKTDIETLTKALENTEQLITKQVQALARLEERVYEKQEEINKVKKDFSVLESDNMLLKSEVNQYRNTVVELKRKIRGLEATLKQSHDHAKEESTEEKKEEPKEHRPITFGQVTEPPAPQKSDNRGERTFKNRVSSDVTEVKQQNENLIDKVTTLEMKVIEKETKNMRMEHDVSELLENIRVASPEAIRHLRRSVDLTRYLPAAEFDDDDDPSAEVALPVGNGPETNSPDARSTPTFRPPSKTKQVKCRSSSPVTRPKPPAELLLQMKSAHQSFDGWPEFSEDGAQPTLADFNREREHRSRMATELESVKKELARAKREIVSLQFGGNRSYALGSDRIEKTANKEKKGDSEDDKDTASPPPADRIEVPREWSRRRSTIQPPNVAKLLAKVSPSTAADSTAGSSGRSHEERTLYEQLKSQGLHKAAPRRNVRVIRETSTATKATAEQRKSVGIGGHAALMEEGEGEGEEGEDARGTVGGAGGVHGEGTLDDEGNIVSFEEYVIVDQGMQTDPLLDPLGAWSITPAHADVKPRRRSASPRRRSASPRRRGYIRSSGLPLPPPPDEWTQYDPTPIKSNHIGAMTSQERRHTHARKKSARSRPTSATDGIFFVERELSRIISGIRGFTAYVSQLIAREVSDLAESNDEIRRRMSERSLKRIERMVCGPEQTDVNEEKTEKKAPIRRGRFELTRTDNQSSNFVNRLAFSSYFAGRRGAMEGAPPLPIEDDKEGIKPLLDSTHPFALVSKYLQGADAEAHRRLVREMTGGRVMMTSCDRWGVAVDMIGRHAIDVLRGTADFFKQTVEKQIVDHEVLNEGIKMKEEIESALKGNYTGEDIPLKLKRSLSHSSFLEHSHGVTFKTGSLRPPTIPAQSKSLSSIQSSHRYLPSLMIPSAQKPTNRDEMVIPKAVLPRKGMVRLQAIGVKEDDVAKTEGKREPKGYRPSPQNHRKLLMKQRNLVKKTKSGTGEGENDSTTLKHILFQLQIPEETTRQKGQRKKNLPNASTAAQGANTAKSFTSGSVSQVLKVAKRQLSTGGELRGKVLSVFTS